MLQRIRDRISGWIAGVVIALIGGAFILFGVEYYFEQGSATQNDVAVVNDVSITQAQFETYYTQLQRRTEMQMGGLSLSDALKAELKSYALQSLVTQTALKTVLLRDGFRIGMPQVKAMVEAAPEFQENGQFSEDKWMQILYQMGLSPEIFLQNIQTEWLTNQAMNGIASSTFALPAEVNHQYVLAHQQRSFGYFIISAKNFLSKAQVTDQDITQYYQANLATYHTLASVSVAYLELSPATIEKQITVTPAAAKSYYDAHLSAYQVPERWMISQITVPVAANALSADIQKAQVLATSYAQLIAQKKTTPVKAQIVTVSAAQIDAPLRATLAGLTVGKTSSPLRTANGYTLITLQKVEPATTKNFASVQKIVTDLLIHQRVNQILTKQGAQLSDLTYINPNSLDDASKTLNLPIQTSKIITKSGEKTGLFSDPKILAAVFSESVFQSGNNSGSIQLKDGSQVVLRVAKKNPSQVIPLATVREKIKQQLSEKQASAQAGLLAFQLQNQLASSDANPMNIAVKNDLNWHTSALMQQKDKTTIPAPVVDAAFASKPKHPKAFLYNATDFAVVSVLQIKTADLSKATPASLDQLKTQVSTLWGQLLQHYFVDSVTQASKIKITSHS